MIRKEDVEFYFNRKIMVHIKKISTNRFYNGFIVELNDLMIVIKDRELGEIPIRFDDIGNLEPFTEDKK